MSRFSKHFLLDFDFCVFYAEVAGHFAFYFIFI